MIEMMLLMRYCDEYWREEEENGDGWSFKRL